MKMAEPPELRQTVDQVYLYNQAKAWGSTLGT